jgi:hypothetical protein
MARRWIPSPTMIGDLARARGISAAALESTRAPNGKPVPADDKQSFADFMTAAVSALDSAIAIADRNKPKPKKVLEDLPNGL